MIKSAISWLARPENLAALRVFKIIAIWAASAVSLSVVEGASFARTMAGDAATRLADNVLVEVNGFKYDLGELAVVTLELARLRVRGAPKKAYIADGTFRGVVCSAPRASVRLDIILRIE